MANGNSRQRLKRLKKILSIGAITHYLCTRFGSPRLRGWAFAREYQKGRRNCSGDSHSSQSQTVSAAEEYARKGRILDLGCGADPLAFHLNPDRFESYLGVDVSPLAISMAQKRKSPKINFEIGDLRHYKCKEKYDLIVFEESLYYVPFFRRRLLRRYARRLRPGGLFLVTIRDPDRFRGMIRMIRKNFQVVEDRFASPTGGRLILVFR